MEESIITIVTSVLMTAIVQISKRFGLNPKHALGILTIVLTAIYFLFYIFLPEGTRQDVVAFLTSRVGGAIIAYEFFWKKYGETIMKKLIKNLNNDKP